MGKKNTPKKSGFNTQKIFKFVRIAALALPAAMIAIGPGTGQQKLARGARAYFGIEPGTKQFKLGNLAEGWAPFVGSILVTYGIPKLAGIIRSS